MKPRLHDHVYTLLELVTAVIVICLLIVGIVAVARYAQNRARSDVTKRLLIALDQAARQYMHDKNVLPADDSLRPDDPPDVRIAAFIEDIEGHDASLLVDLPAYLRQAIKLAGRPYALPVQIVRDGWGTPVSYQIIKDPRGAPPRAVFISAGPNRTHTDDPDNYDNIRSDEPQ